MKQTPKATLFAGLLAAVTLVPPMPVLAQQAGADAATRPAPGGWPRFDLKAFDTDGDGTVTLAEIQEKRRAEAAGLDADGDGKISADELVAFEMNRLRPGVEARVAARIKALDSDGDGLLSAAELAMAPGPMMMFDRLDANSDGAISADELRDGHRKMMRGGDRAQMRHDRGEGRHGDHGPRAERPPVPEGEN